MRTFCLNIWGKHRDVRYTWELALKHGCASYTAKYAMSCLSYLPTVQYSAWYKEDILKLCHLNEVCCHHWKRVTAQVKIFQWQKSGLFPCLHNLLLCLWDWLLFCLSVLPQIAKLQLRVLSHVQGAVCTATWIYFYFHNVYWVVTTCQWLFQNPRM